MNRPALLLLLLATASEAGAQAIVQGRVITPDSVGIAGARVQVSDSAHKNPYQAITDSTGAFRIRLSFPMRPGPHYASVEMLGYRALTRVPIPIADREDLTILLTMDIDAIPLAPLRVSARDRYVRGPLDDYYDRADRVSRFGGGTIVRFEELQRRPFTNIAALIAEYMPGMRNCFPSFFLDGMRLMRDDLRMISAGTLEGVEIYRNAAMVPAEFQNRADCGAVLLWSQRGDPNRGSPLTWRRVFMAVGFLAVGWLLIR